MIKIQNLYKRYGSKEVLQGLNMEFSKGGVYGVIGANGAGKTTLFKCISGLENYQGTIISEIDPLKNHLGLLWTVPYFFSKITGREYIRLLCNARNIKIGNIDEKNIFELPLDRFASQYSTGMKKKLALTAILLQQNQVFILDEPFNGVDMESNILIESIINELKKLGKTLIISSHIFASLKNLCDEIFLLKDGIIEKHVGKDAYSQLEDLYSDRMVNSKLTQLNLK